MVILKAYAICFHNWYHNKKNICLLDISKCVSGEKFVWFDFTLTPVLMIDKKGEKNLRVICMLSKIYVYAIYFCIANRRKRFWFMLIACFISILAYIFMCLIAISIILCYAWVKGELLWSFTLIHAYITSWVLSSSKRGRLLAQRPITLVLMMINSWSYVY